MCHTAHAEESKENKYEQQVEMLHTTQAVKCYLDLQKKIMLQSSYLSIMT